MSGIKTIAAICCMMSAFHVTMCYGSVEGELIFSSPLYYYKTNSGKINPVPKVNSWSHLEFRVSDKLRLHLLPLTGSTKLSILDFNGKRILLYIRQNLSLADNQVSIDGIKKPVDLYGALKELQYNPQLEDEQVFDMLCFREHSIEGHKDNITELLEDNGKYRIVLLNSKLEVHIIIGQDGACEKKYLVRTTTGTTAFDRSIELYKKWEESSKNNVERANFEKDLVTLSRDRKSVV